jgi:hypothetical protein
MRVGKSAVGYWFIKDDKERVIGMYANWRGVARRWLALTGEVLPLDD